MKLTKRLLVQSIHYRTPTHVFLVRGEFASRPLYYLQNPKLSKAGYEWYVSHNLRELGRHVQYQPDPDGVRDYLCYGFVPAPRTLFKNIAAVPPGMQCSLSLQNGSIDCQPLNTLSRTCNANPEQTFWQQLQAHLPAEHSAVLLSGGLDSAMITAAAVEKRIPLQQAFHICFSGSDLTEDGDTIAARSTARHFGLPLHELTINSWQAMRWFGAVVNAMPQPFADPVTLPFYLMFRHMNKRGVTQVLTGEGGDQLFGSWSMKPMLMRELYPEDDYCRAQGYLSSFHKFSGEWQDILSDELLTGLSPQEQLHSPIAEAFSGSSSSHFCDQLRWVDLHLKGLQHIQPRIEAMAGVHGLRLHHPFFRPEVIETAKQLSPGLKMTGTQEKVLLKKIAASHLPEQIFNRRKQGMGVPTSKWFRYGLRPLAMYWLNKRKLLKSGLLNPDYVEAMIVNNKSVKDARSRRWGDRLWQLCVLECWFAGLNSSRIKS